ncbi:hypothetical protein HIM_10427 [Hirsutella minnesotensis 3608]|uniref:Uncharacterized protein n=1 Tax=Hirsutella minnesotensis 3608 TaxID=1043627 RepID=A0A0F7ZX62_9HYPO|nr:hypothetical protein HIM_10427 [Hirsutella minnesotensis 3608]
MTENHHVRVHSRCGACGFRFDPGDLFYACEKPVALRSGTITIDAAAIVCQGAFGKAKFPESGYCENQHNHPWVFCRIPECRHCRSSPDCATVHAQCLKLFFSDCKEEKRPKLRWLWLAATWRSPWQGALPLDVEPAVGYRDSHGILDELPRMLLLPPELKAMIWEFCAPSPLWVFTAVSDLRAEMAASRQHKRSAIPLIKINSWARGCGLKYSNSSGSPIIRLTFDSRGLRRIERLSMRPSKSSSGSDFNAFIVESVERFYGVLVEFEHDLARLQLPAGEANAFYIWDIPCPPTLERCFDNLSHPLSPCHLGTVQLRGCTGITFFMSGASTYAVHVHTSNRPFAQATFEALPIARQRMVSWVYVPIDGQITKFGFSHVSKRAGNVSRQSLLVAAKHGTYRRTPHWAP